MRSCNASPRRSSTTSGIRASKYEKWRSTYGVCVALFSSLAPLYTDQIPSLSRPSDAPEFADDEINRHGILDRNGSLICNVSDSNPPATRFQFFKDDAELADTAKYRLEVNEDKQFAILHVRLRRFSRPICLTPPFADQKGHRRRLRQVSMHSRQRQGVNNANY